MWTDSKCGDGVLSVLEECDSSMFCANSTCTCLPGHQRNTATGLCSGCGNNLLDPGEECDGSEGCDNTSCRCADGFVPNTATAGACIASALVRAPDHSFTTVIASSAVFAVGLLSLLSAFLVFQRFASPNKSSPSWRSCCCSHARTHAHTPSLSHECLPPPPPPTGTRV